MIAVNQLNAMDPNAFGDLKRLARNGNSEEALRAAAKQFEAMFLQMALKAMRDATPPSALFDNEQTQMFQSLHDQQMAMTMAHGRGVGLADVIFRQLGGDRLSTAEMPDPEPDGSRRFDLSSVPRRAAILAAGRHTAEGSAGRTEAVAGLEVAPEAESTSSGAVPVAGTVQERVRSFVERLRAHAGAAGRALGVPPHFMIAQAALETGWGRAEIRREDGSPSYNVFNIKAGRNWNGPVVELPVTEYANGRAYTEVARFRAYGSYAEAFRDYVSLMRNSPRYEAVLGQKDAAAFARSLQDAGYATDPLYADKLTRVIGSPSLRAALNG